MRYLQLRIELPPDSRHPMHQFLVERDALRRAYLRHWNFSNPEYVTTLLLVVGDVEAGRDAYLAALDDVEAVREYDAATIDDRGFYVYVRERAQKFASRLRALLTDTELLVVPPLEYGPDGDLVLEIAGDQAALQALVDGLPEHFSASVDRLGEYDAYRESHVAALTDRQRDVLEVARELGYYDVPREATVREVAEEVGCSKSTAANHLRKAEARLVDLHCDRSTGDGVDAG